MKLIRVLAVVTLAAPLAWAAMFNEDEALEPDIVEEPAAAVAEEASSEAAEAPADEAGDEAFVDDVFVEDELAEAEGVEGAAATTVTPVAAEPAATTVTPVQEAQAEEGPVVEEVFAEEPPVAGGVSHRVVRGDTLWDISGAYLRDPFLWPQIYEANRSIIADPHWIYPDQEFVIPSLGGAVPAGEAVAAAESAPETAEGPGEAPLAAEVPAEETALAEEPETVAAVPEEEPLFPEEEPAVEPEPAPASSPDEPLFRVKTSRQVGGAGFMGGLADTFVADENWEYDGHIIRDRDVKMMISQGDVVYLNIGSGAGVQPKMTAYVYRVGDKVRDPFLKRHSGRLVKRVGALLVTGQITDQGCTAVVISSIEPIKLGDIVKFVTN